MPTPYDATRCDARITLMLTPSPSNPRRSVAGLMRQPFLLAAFVLFGLHMAHACSRDSKIKPRRSNGIDSCH